MPREDPTRPARKHRLQYSRDAAEERLKRARARVWDGEIPRPRDREEARLWALGQLRSALVVAWWDAEWAQDLVAEAYVLLEGGQQRDD